MAVSKPLVPEQNRILKMLLRFCQESTHLIHLEGADSLQNCQNLILNV